MVSIVGDGQHEAVDDDGLEGEKGSMLLSSSSSSSSSATGFVSLAAICAALSASWASLLSGLELSLIKVLLNSSSSPPQTAATCGLGRLSLLFPLLRLRARFADASFTSWSC